MFLLAFYLLLLPFLSMAGTIGCDELAHLEATAVSGADHPEDHEENCASFCNCSCCFHVASPHFELQKLTPLKTCFLQVNYSLYPNNFYPQGISGNIWQPPKA
jgi:hypothetical protein